MKAFFKKNKNLIGLFVVLSVLAAGTIVLIGISKRYNSTVRTIRGKYSYGDQYIHIGTDGMIFLNLDNEHFRTPQCSWRLIDDDMVFAWDGDEVAPEYALFIDADGETAKVYLGVRNDDKTVEYSSWEYDYDETTPLYVLKREKNTARK